MSGGITAGMVMAGAAVAGAAATVYNGQQQASAQKKAQNQAMKQADAQASAAEQSMNAANRKTPNTRNMVDSAMQAGRQGASGTMLTGPQGVDPNAMSLGKNTLLGG